MWTPNFLLLVEIDVSLTASTSSCLSGKYELEPIKHFPPSHYLDPSQLTNVVTNFSRDHIKWIEKLRIYSDWWLVVIYVTHMILSYCLTV